MYLMNTYLVHGFNQKLAKSVVALNKITRILFSVFKVRCAVNQTFSFDEDLQEMKEAQKCFMKFFEEKLR